ncbi:hypothetical protein EYF80_066372 [Liparis tanakae]|uniref:Uncharacterized protein n=1 Tax=Liparis tanakae TaxID=230148 RepID=A0A4Z2E3Z2_9TELE|nr:hypothetical protein EYF80_066372 [Liparis tanakae]
MRPVSSEEPCSPTRTSLLSLEWRSAPPTPYEFSMLCPPAAELKGKPLRSLEALPPCSASAAMASCCRETSSRPSSRGGQSRKSPRDPETRPSPGEAALWAWSSGSGWSRASALNWVQSKALRSGSKTTPYDDTVR